MVAIVLDVAEPLLFGAEGWQLVPGHFAERHGLIIIIALGESIVAIGVGAEGDVDAGIIVAACLGIAIAAALWWAYFDVVAVVAARHLASRPAGRVQNAMARDSYSILHFPMVAGIVLIALGMKKTLEHVDEPLETVVTATALVGGAALYLLAPGGVPAAQPRHTGTCSGWSWRRCSWPSYRWPSRWTRSPPSASSPRSSGR